ncbi:ABC transporter ATP-binding protein [Candidatus Poribacteria bacterium]|nr:ABC transporter ATP-binding protein [Candidatus Poribacteria bacterium]
MLSGNKNYQVFIRFALPYKKRVMFIFLCMFLYTIFNGISLGMIQPLFDQVLVPPNSSNATFFDSTNTNNISLLAETKNNESLFNKISNFANNLKRDTKQKIFIYSGKKLLKIIIIIILIATLFKALFNILHSYHSLVITQKILRDIRNALYEHLQILPLDYFRRKKTGNIISHITNDVILLDDFISQGVVKLVLNIFSVILFGIILFYLHWKLALFSILVLILTIYPIKKIGQKIYKLSTKLQENMGEITAIINESLNGVKSVKTFCRENHEKKKFSQVNQNITRNLVRSARLNAILNPFVELMATLGLVLVLLYGGKEIVEGRLSGGQFILFLGAFLSLENPLKKLSQVTGYMKQGTAAIERVSSILELKADNIKSISDQAFNGIQKNIVFKNIFFRYGPELYTLNDINLQINKGEIVAIVGSSGAGKSTLSDMLPRFLEPESGVIEIDGVNIRNYNIKSLRDKIVIVSQEVILFHDTIKNNIAYAKPNASDEEIENAARLAYAHEFISKLPDKYNTIIGERGSMLSGGQRQRISIARGILKNPPIFILDEATSNIDTQSEKLVQDAINNLMQDKTTIIIAHRFSSIKQAHKVVLMETGKITAIGTHEELLQTSGQYKYLWELQHGGEQK